MAVFKQINGFFIAEIVIDPHKGIRIEYQKRIYGNYLF